MAQRHRNNQKKHSEHPQNTKKKPEPKEIPQTPIKKNATSSQQPNQTYLSPLPIPPKLDNSNHYVYSSNYSYSSEIQQIYTPIIKQHPRFMPAQDQPTMIMNKIIFQSDEDQQNNSSSISSEDNEEATPNSSVLQSSPQESQPSDIQQQSSGQLSQNPLNTFEKDVKIRNKNPKERMNNQQPKQTNPNKKIFCNCKKTKCLKLYCDCFRLNQTCEGCNCVGCHNLQIYSQERNNAILSLMDRNPDPFSQKIEADKHLKGCNCKKSNCLKKYCECYQAGLKCGQNCKCEQCKNMPVEIGGPEGDKPGVAKTTAKKQKQMVQI